MNYDLPLYTRTLKRRPSLKNAQRLQDAFQDMKRLKNQEEGRVHFYKDEADQLREIRTKTEQQLMDLNMQLGALTRKNTLLEDTNHGLTQQLASIRDDRANYKSKWEAAKELLSQVLAGTRNGI